MRFFFWLILILITLKKRKEEEDENADLGENTNLDMNSISAAGISGSTPVTSGYGGKGKYDESELEELAKKSRNRRWLALLPYAILIVVFTILGDCKWEIPCDVIGTLVVGVTDYATWKHKFKEVDKEERR